MTSYDAAAGTVWQLDETVFVLLDGHVDVGAKEMYRKAFNLTRGELAPFGLGSWMDMDSVRIA